MRYRLIRLVAVTISREVEVSSWAYDAGDVHVQSIPHPHLIKDPGTLFLLAADVELSAPLPMERSEILVPNDLRRKLEDAIESIADLLSITHQCSRSVTSVMPYVAIDPVDGEAKEWLATATAIRVEEGGVPDRMKHTLDLDTVAPLLADRLDGASLLAEALCQKHPTGKLHEYIRLFERAFARSAGEVCRDLLADFLKPRDWGYEQTEIDHWLHLRHLATHADRRREYAVEADTRPVVNRMEQAAFDVLFNKETWHTPNLTRRSAFNPVYGSLSPRGLNMFKTASATVQMVFAFFDGFHAYPLDLRLDLLRYVPQTWFTRTTGMKEPLPAN
jgi:hypothetical protein